MAFPNLLKRLFDSNGAGITLRGDIMPYGTAAPKAHGTAAAGSAETLSRSDHVHPLQTTVSGNAGSATKLATKRTIDGVNFDGSANIHHYGTCSTAADTAAKTVALANFVLATGAIAFIRFTVTNTASSPTLNINATGAKAIRYRNAGINASHLAADRTYCFIYDGSYYQLVGDIDTNTTYTAASAAPKAPGTAAVGTSTKYAREDHVHPLQTTVSGSSGSCSGNSATATKLAAKRTIDGVSFDGSANIHHYGTCSTDAGTAAKTVTLANFVLATGAEVTVRFTVTNTASNPTLNVNGTGAKAIKYRNAAISAGYLAANRTYRFVYDGSSYELVGDVDTNTTYTAATAAPKDLAKAAATGTSKNYAREDHVHKLPESVGKLSTKRTIDGVQFDGEDNIHHYGACSTAAGTAAKTVTLSGFVLDTGAEITVKFSSTNTAANPTLNVNSTGAKGIRYKNAAVPSGYIVANKTYRFVYDGTYWQIVGDVIAELQAQIDALAQQLASPWDCIPVGIPIPVVGVKFGGSDGRRAIMPGESKARENWIICDGGSDGKGGKVPNLKGRFLYGADDDHAAGSTGGSATHTHSISGTVGATTLSVEQMPGHNHTANVGKFHTGGNNRGTYASGDNVVASTSQTGGSQSHTHSLSGASSEAANSLPPYYAGHYVIRV